MRRADFAAVCPSFTLRLRPRPQLEVRALLPGENGPGLPRPQASLRVPPKPDSVGWPSHLLLTPVSVRTERQGLVQNAGSWVPPPQTHWIRLSALENASFWPQVRQSS